MSISAINSSPYTFTRTDHAKVSGSGSSAFGSALDAAAGDTGQGSAGGVEAPDFTHMTRKDLAEWVNSKIKSGEMPLAGSETFVSMTVHVPTHGAYTGLDGTEQVNFMQTAQNGMAWARQHNNSDLLTRLQAALDTMQRFQGTAGDAHSTA